MKAVVILFLALSFQSLALAEWKVTERVDAMTDEVKRTAIVKNNEGHSFSIYRISKGGAVWGNFALSERRFDQVDWGNPPMYRVDKNKSVSLEKMKKTQELFPNIQAYEWEPKWVNFLIWHGKEDEGIADNLVQIMEGNKIVFRYYLSTGGYKDTFFTLKGSTSAISEAIGINEKIDHSAQQKGKKFRQAYIAETKKCQQNMRTFKSCFSRVKECRNQANNDLSSFKLCMQN